MHSENMRTHEIVKGAPSCGRRLGKTEKPKSEEGHASCRRCKTIRKYGRR